MKAEQEPFCSASMNGGQEGRNWWAYNTPALLIFALALALLLALGLRPVVSFGAVGIGYLILKLLLSCGYRPAAAPEEDGHERVAVIVPVYNEDPGALASCLESVLAQSRRPDEIFVVDDGSSDDDCLRTARWVLRDHPEAIVERLPQNRGKRHAQAWAVQRATADVIVTIDSDTVLDPGAMSHLLVPFRRPDVQAVTAYVRALNHRRNVLTKLIALRYANVFLYERAAYSQLGSVVCCCGSLTALRSSIFMENLDDYVRQTFLGRNVMYGDDRRLTNYALKRGRVVLQSSAVASTIVPERLGHFARQQVRWTKSFFRETLWALRNFRPNRWVWWLSLAELAGWMVTSAAPVVALVLRPEWLTLRNLGAYLAFLAIVSYMRSVRYLQAEPHTTRYEIGVFLLAPLYGLLHFLLLVPLRYYAMATLRESGWGTRAKVEVRLGGSGEVPATDPLRELEALVSHALGAEVRATSRQVGPRSSG